MKAVRIVLALLGATFVLALPFTSTKTYFVHIGALTGIYIILALSFDLVVGQVGALSFAHPAFFGIGAYTAAILSLRFDTPFLLNLVIGAILAGFLAILIGIPSFRLSSYSFAMGTLGMALVAQLVVRNWVSLTRGPLCISQVPNAAVGIPGLFRWEATGPTQNYYLVIVLVVIVATIVRRLVNSRVGRAFQAVREDEILAASRAVNPLLYKMIAFTVSAMLASVAGVFFAHFISVVCPTLLAIDVTITLLVIEFLGGMGSMAGIIVGAIIFTALPEYLRITASARPLIYGVILLLIIIFAPEGLAGLIGGSEDLLRQKIEGGPMSNDDLSDASGVARDDLDSRRD
jgi:ABC-type branched-subunit amino acid transport system permease subunit